MQTYTQSKETYHCFVLINNYFIKQHICSKRKVLGRNCMKRIKLTLTIKPSLLIDIAWQILNHFVKSIYLHSCVYLENSRMDNLFPTKLDYYSFRLLIYFIHSFALVSDLFLILKGECGVYQGHSCTNMTLCHHALLRPLPLIDRIQILGALLNLRESFSPYIKF